MHLVFDLDGVLLDSASSLDWFDRAVEATLVELDVDPTEENMGMLYRPSTSRFEAAAQSFGVSLEELWDVRERFYLREKTDAIRTGEIGAFRDVHVLNDLAEAYPLSIISNSPQPVVDAFLDLDEIPDQFEAAVGRGSDLTALSRMKPDPYPFDRLDDLVGADSYVYVGDTDSDRTFAERAGMEYLHLDRWAGDLDSLAAVRIEVESTWPVHRRE